MMFDYILLYVTGNMEVLGICGTSQLKYSLISILLLCLESWEAPNIFGSRTSYCFVQIKEVVTRKFPMNILLLCLLSYFSSLSSSTNKFVVDSTTQCTILVLIQARSRLNDNSNGNEPSISNSLNFFIVVVCIVTCIQCKLFSLCYVFTRCS